MSMVLFAKFLIFLGCSSLIGGGLPQKNILLLLQEYKKAILNSQKPTLEQQGAYYTWKFYQIGLLLVSVGFIGLLFD